MTIEAYLAELERRLPRFGRGRVLGEVEEHLRDSAARQRSAGSVPFDAEAAATREFGAVRDVSRRLGAEMAVRETRIAAALALTAVAFFVFPLYVVPENTLPPATWAEKPSEIEWRGQTAIGLWIVAGALAFVSAALAWTRWLRLATLALFGATIAIAASIAMTVMLVVLWFQYMPATPGWALSAPLALASLVTCAGASTWARSSRRRLVDAD